MSAEPTTVDLLDICIDALIRGDDWRACVDGPAPEDVAKLMVVAESIRDAANDTPRSGPRQRFRVWKRVFHGRQALEGRLDRPGQDGLLSFRRKPGPWRRCLPGRQSGAVFAPSHPIPTGRWL